MSEAVLYQYKGDVPSTKIVYSYSKFYGQPFINGWAEYRNQFIKQDVADFSLEAYFKENEKVSTEILFNEWVNQISHNTFDFSKLNLLLKRFEVTKKLYESYDENFRPISNELFFNKDVYLKFAFVLVTAYKETKKLMYLNALIKVNDINCCFYQELDSKQISMMSYVLKEEQNLIKELMNRLSI